MESHHAHQFIGVKYFSLSTWTIINLKDSIKVTKITALSLIEATQITVQISIKQCIIDLLIICDEKEGEIYEKKVPVILTDSRDKISRIIFWLNNLFRGKQGERICSYKIIQKRGYKPSNFITKQDKEHIHKGYINNLREQLNLYSICLFKRRHFAKLYPAAQGSRDSVKGGSNIIFLLFLVLTS